MVDHFAADVLVNASHLQDFILRKRPLYGRREIIGFAHRIIVHPGIVVGQLQHRDEVKYLQYRPMLKKVRNIITQSASV